MARLLPLLLSWLSIAALVSGGATGASPGSQGPGWLCGSHASLDRAYLDPVARGRLAFAARLLGEQDPVAPVAPPHCEKCQRVQAQDLILPGAANLDVPVSQQASLPFGVAASPDVLSRLSSPPVGSRAPPLPA